MLFVADAREGLTGLDHDVAELLRQSAKPVLLAVNKADGEERAGEFAGDFYSRGFLVPVSAAHGRGIPELREIIADLLPEAEDDEAPLTDEEAAAAEAAPRPLRLGHDRPSQRREVPPWSTPFGRDAAHCQRCAGHHPRRRGCGLHARGHTVCLCGYGRGTQEGPH